MLWRRMDEMLVKLFARHNNAMKYEGNPVGEFWASIVDDKYRPDVMPESIGM